MDPETLAPTGFSRSEARASTALATSLIPAVVVGGGSDSLERPSAPTQNPAQLLASLMDLPGSVALADLLAEPLPTAAPGPSRSATGDPSGVADRTVLGERLLMDAAARLDSLEPMVLKPLLGRRAPGVPAAYELLFSLRQHRIEQDRSEANIQRLADDLGAPFRSALGLSLRQAQAHVATLRWEITHDLRALGPRAAQLERLDAALSRSMQAKLGELLDRMEHAAHLTFVRACSHAVESLPDSLDEAALAGWCHAEGWLARYRERCVRMAKALFGHLRRSLEGLMRAAVIVDAQDAQTRSFDAFDPSPGSSLSAEPDDDVTPELNPEDA